MGENNTQLTLVNHQKPTALAEWAYPDDVHSYLLKVGRKSKKTWKHYEPLWQCNGIALLTGPDIDRPNMQKLAIVVVSKEQIFVLTKFSARHRLTPKLIGKLLAIVERLLVLRNAGWKISSKSQMNYLDIKVSSPLDKDVGYTFSAGLDFGKRYEFKTCLKVLDGIETAPVAKPLASKTYSRSKQTTNLLKQKVAEKQLPIHSTMHMALALFPTMDSQDLLALSERADQLLEQDSDQFGVVAALQQAHQNNK